MTEKTEDLAELDRLRLATEDAAGGPPSVEQVEALIELVDALEARLAALTTPQEGDARSPWTQHGHLLPGRTPDENRPPVARCGGPKLCRQCSAEAGNVGDYPEGLRAAAPEPRLDPYLTPAEIAALPEGSVVMTETDVETFGVYEQRVWQRFAGASDWQFGTPRHDWQSTDGGFVQMRDSEHYPVPVFAMNRRVRLLYTPGPLPVGGDDGE